MIIFVGFLVVFLIYDGFCMFEFGIVVEVFGLSWFEMGLGWYCFVSVVIELGLLCVYGGVIILFDGGFEFVEYVDMIIVLGWKGINEKVLE